MKHPFLQAGFFLKTHACQSPVKASLSFRQRFWESQSEGTHWETCRGIPFLSRIPVLKYLFGTTTHSREKSYLYITAFAEIPDTGVGSMIAGKLTRLK